MEQRHEVWQIPNVISNQCTGRRFRKFWISPLSDDNVAKVLVSGSLGHNMEDISIDVFNLFREQKKSQRRKRGGNEWGWKSRPLSASCLTLMGFYSAYSPTHHTSALKFVTLRVRMESWPFYFYNRVISGSIRLLQTIKQCGSKWWWLCKILIAQSDSVFLKCVMYLILQNS